MAMAWSAPESGILRKTVPTGNIDDLLVFGYACKIFRDDEKALLIDQGKHLIPWMGDVKLKIDRYDCRGHLSDISKYEASREGYDAMRWLGLSDKERQLEELCDKERYYSLEINEEEEEMYKEEEQKRRQTNAIAYSYDVPTDPDAKSAEETVQGAEEADEEYKPPPILDVPVDIDKPKTVKENAIIEKTALFVCRQGLQMEILIKAKQGENPQFSFLNQGDRLNKFYRHVLTAFKSGIYKGYDSMNMLNSENLCETRDQDQNSHYLHPSLLSAANAQPEQPAGVTVPQIPYRPSVNCTYSQLVSRIQGSQNDGQERKEAVAEQPTDYAQMTYEQQQYYQYYYMQQYYEYCKQLAAYQQGQAGNSGQPIDFENLDPNMQAYIQQMAYAQYVQHFQQQSSNNSYAQIVSNVNKEGNPYTAQVPQLPQNLVPQNDTKDEQKPNVVGDNCEVVVKKPILSLAAYGSGSDTQSDSDDENEEKEEKKIYKVPTGEAQAVIDKMAIYVSKNGEQFEEIVKTKGDARFSFLNNGHEFHNYYKEKIRELKGGVSKRHSPKTKQSKDTDNDTKPAKKEKKVIAPVSFSIKKAKEDQPKEIKSALPVEESDEEETLEEQAVTPIAPAPVTLVASVTRQPESKKSANESVETASKEDDSKKTTSFHVNEKSKEEVSCKRSTESRKYSKDSSNGKSEEDSPKKNGILDGEDPILEMIELSGDIDDKKDAKRAEDKIKDKLAAAAREKMAKDRALQLERRRRAAAFLKLKSAETLVTDTKVEKSSSPARRDSVEVILDTSDEKANSESSRSKSKSPVKKYKDRSRSPHRSGSKDAHRKRARSTDSERSRSREREKKKEKSKKKKSKKERRSSLEEGEYVGKKHEDGKEKKKKSHKRKHSKHKKKSKKHRRRSVSESPSDSDTS